MKILSLFDGISGAFEAIKKVNTNFEYFSSEVDEACIYLTKQNKQINQLGDIKNFKKWEIPKIDLIIGGSPCQGFSSAGKQRGFKDNRSNLIEYYFEAIDYFKPKYFIFENVRMNFGDRAVISKKLKTDYLEINSNRFVPQSRNRLYWANFKINTLPPTPPYKNNLYQKNKKRFKKIKKEYTTLTDIIKCGKVDKECSFCIDANYYRTGNLNNYYNKRLKQVVFQWRDYVRRLFAEEVEILQGFPEGYTKCLSTIERYQALGNSFTVPVIEHIIRSIK